MKKLNAVTLENISAGGCAASIGASIGVTAGATIAYRRSRVCTGRRRCYIMGCSRLLWWWLAVSHLI